MREFEPHPLLRNAHLMTLAANYLVRKYPRLPAPTDRLFEVEPGTRLLGRCHWQAEPRRHPTLVLVHGLEGSSESHYMLGIVEKAFVAGFNAVRMNQRNCGGTERLTHTLYNSGLSGDYRAVLRELAERDRLPELFFCGYSMGGNLVLKMAGELGGQAPPELNAVCAVCPSIDLAACADALERRENFIYQWHFVRSLMQSYERKRKVFPQIGSADGLGPVRTVRRFDDVITAPHFGFHDAQDYYQRSSALRVIGQIRVPTLVLTAQNDPFIPFESFRDPAVTVNPCIRLIAPRHGGHCAFLSRHTGEERYWAESRVVEFCQQQSRLVCSGAGLAATPVFPGIR